MAATQASRVLRCRTTEMARAGPRSIRWARLDDSPDVPSDLNEAGPRVRYQIGPSLPAHRRALRALADLQFFLAPASGSERRYIPQDRKSPLKRTDPSPSDQPGIHAREQRCRPMERERPG